MNTEFKNTHRPVLVLGGYGNFGKRISLALAKENIHVVIAGRDLGKANKLAQDLKTRFPASLIETASFDVNLHLKPYCEQLRPFIVINTCGPFQTTDYRVAQVCLDLKIHYLDLADGRDFVNGISQFNDAAKQSNILIASGASTVPALSSAVVEAFLPQFSAIHSLKYGISPGQKAPRGLATTESILTYLGKPLKPYPHIQDKNTHYGWQDHYQQTYPILGSRWMANCDIPDLDLFPKHYGIERIQFSAGMESPALHMCMAGASWLVRLGLPLNLGKHAAFLLQVSHWFDSFGTDNGGMHMILEGKDKENKPKKIEWYIIAERGDGPQIPCIPAIVLTQKLLSNTCSTRGAVPCAGLINLTEYMEALKGFNVVYYTDENQ